MTSARLWLLAVPPALTSSVLGPEDDDEVRPPCTLTGVARCPTSFSPTRAHAAGRAHGSLSTPCLGFVSSRVALQDDEAAASAPPETDDLLVCQFEKVAHVKDRWKIILKDGILRVNNKDFVFSRAIGEFDW